MSQRLFLPSISALHHLLCRLYLWLFRIHQPNDPHVCRQQKGQCTRPLLIHVTIVFCSHAKLLATSMVSLLTMKTRSRRKTTKKRWVPSRTAPIYKGYADQTQIKALTQRLAIAGITHFNEPDIEYVLNAPYAKGDPKKAYELLLLLEDSEEGLIRKYNPNVKLLGAINRHGVSCFLDSLLFAMFARLGSFEAILYNTFEDEPRKRLATLLRLWVNTLRAGKLITVDIVCSLTCLLS